MEFLKENKGVIIFYIMLAVFTFVLVNEYNFSDDGNNKYVMLDK